ncbi:hypothetical protein I317_03332 [Kwoniella heveanensis CBS 569]|nr:hypothetical protein I317_03332 [Kwoniella heveanensis CBS 569]
MGFFGSSAPAQLHPVNPPLGVFPNFYAQRPTTLVLKEKVFSFSGDDFSVKDTNGYTVVRCHGQAMSFRDRKVIVDANNNFLFGLRNKMLAIHKTFIAESESGTEIFKIRKRMSWVPVRGILAIVRSKGRTDADADNYASSPPLPSPAPLSRYPSSGRRRSGHANPTVYDLLLLPLHTSLCHAHVNVPTPAVGSKMEATFHNPATSQEVTLLLRGDFWGGSADITVENGPVVAQITRELMNARQIFGGQQTYFVTVAPGVDLALIAALCICFDEAKNENNNG